MPINTMYKNFMGLHGPGDKHYGLTRRMIQIYLLCLAREGRVRIGLSAKSGLPHAHIDYANIKDIDFTAAVLASLSDVQKMARPENWEVLRPYAEKLLEKAISATYEEAAIAEDRKKLRDLFAGERESAPRVQAQAHDLFAALGAAHPYATEVDQAVRLFTQDLSGGDDIPLILHALKEAYGYRAFDANQADPQEVDDLANRLRNFRDVRRFLTYDRDLRTAHAYAELPLPEGGDWKAARRLQRDLAKKLADLRPYIDSDVRLRTELLGHMPPQPGEKGTLGCLIHEYTTVYAALHDAVHSQFEAERARIDRLVHGEMFQALRKLEGIAALGPPVADQLLADVRGLADKLFFCPSPSRASVEERLRHTPVHDCALMPAKAEAFAAVQWKMAESAETMTRAALARKLELFLNPAIRRRLEQGRKEPLIDALLACKTADDVQAVLAPAVVKSDEAVAVVNRWLKEIVVTKVRLADFRPSLATVEREQVPQVVHEFQRFLEEKFAAMPDGKDSLPVLQLE
jgi:hypothetical protein